MLQSEPEKVYPTNNGFKFRKFTTLNLLMIYLYFIYYWCAKFDFSISNSWNNNIISSSIFTKTYYQRLSLQYGSFLFIIGHFQKNSQIRLSSALTIFRYGVTNVPECFALVLEHFERII